MKNKTMTYEEAKRGATTYKVKMNKARIPANTAARREHGKRFNETYFVDSNISADPAVFEHCYFDHRSRCVASFRHTDPES